MTEELNMDWIEEGLQEPEHDKELETLLEEYHNGRKQVEKTAFEYFRLGLEKLIQEWEEWK